MHSPLLALRLCATLVVALAAMPHASSQTTCPNPPPAPVPGATVVWSSAASPYQICGDLTIPDTATVLVEAGVSVDFDAGTQLLVDGVLQLLGSQAEPVRLTAPAIAPPFIEVRDGALVEGTHAVVDGGQIRIRGESVTRFTDSTFSAEPCLGCLNGSIRSDGTFFPLALPFLEVERCTFETTTQDGSGLQLVDTLARVRDSRFVGAGLSVLRGYADLWPGPDETAGPIEIAGSALAISRQETIQPLAVDAVDVDGSPAFPGLRLTGGTYALGPQVDVSGALFPLRLEGGLTADSAPVFAGNVNQAIDVGDAGFPGRGHWPALGLPFRITEVSGALPGGELRIAPGVTVEADDPNASLLFRAGRGNALHGLPGAPIVFEGRGGAGWFGLQYSSHGLGPRLEHVEIRDADFGLLIDDSSLIVDRAVFTDNDRGINVTGSTLRLSGGVLSGNQTGLRVTGTGDALIDDAAEPTTIAGNAVGAELVSGSFVDAGNVWWGDASGPAAPGNPGGGDSVIGTGAASASLTPFLTAPPASLAPPPVVRITSTGALGRQATGALGSVPSQSPYVLHWTLPDVPSAAAVASQRIEFVNNAIFASGTVLVDDLPADVRSWQFDMPPWVFNGLDAPPALQVVVVDEFGRESLDRVVLSVVDEPATQDVTLQDDFAGEVFAGGTFIPDVSWTGAAGGFTTVRAALVYENDATRIFGITFGSTASFFGRFPLISTDRARVVLEVSEGGGPDFTVDHVFASEPFAIRHDPRLGLVPPTVALDSPLGGEEFFADGVLPVRWTASAPEGLRNFDVLASYDGGERWHPVVRDLPADAGGYDWRLPPNASLDDVRVRVVARDVQYQNSSADSAPFAFVSSFATEVTGCTGSPAVLAPSLGDLTVGEPTSFVVTADAVETGTAQLLVGLDGTDPSGCGIVLPNKGEFLLGAPFLVATSAPLESGSAGLTIAVPANPSLAGIALRFQAAVFGTGPGGNATELSNGLDAVIGL